MVSPVVSEERGPCLVLWCLQVLLSNSFQRKLFMMDTQSSASTQEQACQIAIEVWVNTTPHQLRKLCTCWLWCSCRPVYSFRVSRIDWYQAELRLPGWQPLSGSHSPALQAVVHQPVPRLSVTAAAADYELHTWHTWQPTAGPMGPKRAFEPLACCDSMHH